MRNVVSLKEFSFMLRWVVKQNFNPHLCKLKCKLLQNEITQLSQLVCKYFGRTKG